MALNNNERVISAFPAPTGLCAKWKNEDGTIELCPEDKVISLVIIEAKYKDGTYSYRQDGFLGGVGIDGELLGECHNFAGFGFENEPGTKPYYGDIAVPIHGEAGE